MTKTLQISSSNLKKILFEKNKNLYIYDDDKKISINERDILSFKKDEYTQINSISFANECAYQYINQQSISDIELNDWGNNDFLDEFLKNHSKEILQCLISRQPLTIKINQNVFLPPQYQNFFKEINGKTEIQRKNFMYLYSKKNINLPLNTVVGNIEVYKDNFEDINWVLEKSKNISKNNPQEFFTFFHKVPENLQKHSELISQMIEICTKKYFCDRNNNKDLMLYDNLINHLFVNEPDQFMQFFIKNKIQDHIFYSLDNEKKVSLKEKISQLSVKDFSELMSRNISSDFIPESIIDKPLYLKCLSLEQFSNVFSHKVYENKDSLFIAFDIFHHSYKKENRNFSGYFYINFIHKKLDKEVTAAEFQQYESFLIKDFKLVTFLIDNMNVEEMKKLNNVWMSQGFNLLKNSSEILGNEKVKVIEDKLLQKNNIAFLNLDNIPSQFLLKLKAIIDPIEDQDNFIKIQSKIFRNNVFKNSNNLSKEILPALFLQSTNKHYDECYLDNQGLNILKKISPEEICDTLSKIKDITQKDSRFKLSDSFFYILPSALKNNVEVCKAILDINHDFFVKLGKMQLHDEVFMHLLTKAPNSQPSHIFFMNDDFTKKYFSMIPSQVVESLYSKYPIHVQKMIDKAKEVNPEQIGSIINIMIDNYAIGQGLVVENTEPKRKIKL